MMRVIGCILLVALVWCGAETLYRAGVTHEGARRDLIEAQASRAAAAVRDGLNRDVRVLQDELSRASADRLTIKTELDYEKQVSGKRAADLASGVARERVLIRTVDTAGRPPGADGSPAGAFARGVDPGAGVEADIDPAVAGWLERVRSDHNAAIGRLDACVRAYDAVKAAADRMP